MANSKKNILVTAVGGASVGSGILHSLVRANGGEGRQRWKVIGADADPFAWGLYKADRAAILPLAGDEGYLTAVQALIDHERVDAIIPGCEAEAEVLSKNQDQISVPVICNRPELMPLMMDKFQVSATLGRLDLPVIETFPVTKWKQAAEKYGFPLIIKPTVGTGGSRGLHLVLSAEEVEVLLSRLPESGQFCVQPYIGSGDEEYTVGVLSNWSGEIIDSIVMRRRLVGLSLMEARRQGERTCAVSTGFSQGFFVKDDEVQQFCEQLAVALGSRGPLNIQLRRSADKLHVFEIHPRFSGTTTMRADVGFNEPDLLLRHVLLGESFGRVNYRSNVAAIRALEHVIVPIDEMLE